MCQMEFGGDMDMYRLESDDEVSWLCVDCGDQLEKWELIGVDEAI